MRRTENMYDEELRSVLEFWDTGSMNGALIVEIERLDKANKRKKKALRQMNKALQRKNEEIKQLEDYIDEIIQSSQPAFVIKK